MSSVVDRSYPTRTGRWPDGDEKDIFRALCSGGRVCEVGCGVGRFAEVFFSHEYVGIDVDEEAIERAKKDNPYHDFRLVDQGPGNGYPYAETYLFVNMLQHIPREDLLLFLGRYFMPRIVISEFMHTELSGRNKSAFHKKPDEYMHWLRFHGFEILDYFTRPSVYQPPSGIKVERHFLIARKPFFYEYSRDWKPERPPWE